MMGILVGGGIVAALLVWIAAGRWSIVRVHLAWTICVCVPAIMLLRSIGSPRPSIARVASGDIPPMQPLVQATAYALIVMALVAAGLKVVLAGGALRRNWTTIPLTHPLVALVAFFCYRCIAASATPPELLTYGNFYAPLLLLAAWLVARTLGPEQFNAFVALLLASICAVSLLSMPFHEHWAYGGEYVISSIGMRRLFGVMDHPSTLYVLALALVTLSFAWTMSWWRRIVCGSLGMACVVLAGTLSGWIAAGVLGAMGVIASIRGRMRVVRPMHLLAGLVLSFLLAFGLVYSEQAQAVVGAGQSRISNLGGRTEIWPLAIRAIGDRPLTGHGMEAFRNPEFQRQYPDVWASHAHNQILDEALIGGLPNSTLLLYLLVCMGLWLHRAPDSPQRRLAIALYVVMLIRGISERPYDLGYVNGGLLIQFLLLGLMAGCRSQDQDSELRSGSGRLQRS